MCCCLLKLHSQILGQWNFLTINNVSPQLVINSVSKCSSDRFSNTKFESSCVKKSQNHTLMFCCAPILGKRFEKQENYGTDFHFITISTQMETKDALQCSFDSFPHMVKYILCLENYQNNNWTHSCLQIVGRLFYNVKKWHGPRIWECHLRNLNVSSV